MAIGCHVSGFGPIRLIALHGWLSDRGVFDGIAPYFDTSRFTVAYMDYRGYGDSRSLNGTFSIDEIADDALELATDLGWGDFHVMGHSMGGMVLQKMALKAPDRISSGIAVTPVAASGFVMDAQTSAFFQSAADDDVALTEIFNILTGERHSKRVLQRLTDAARRATTRTAFLGYLKAWTETDFADAVKSVAAPVLVIAGVHDGAVGPSVMQDTYLKQLPNARMEVLDGAGHYPMIETPAALFKLVEDKLTA